MIRIYDKLLPAWASELKLAAKYPSDEEKVALSIRLAEKNVEEDTGGPFGAALFDEAGHVVSLGANRVVPLENAFYHAEFVCLSGALEMFTGHSLPQGRIFTLASSAQPCCMCTGSILWAGVRRLLVAASREETENLAGFDEGPIHPDWINELRIRGIEVKVGILSRQAADVFRLYTSTGGIIYNGRG